MNDIPPWLHEALVRFALECAKENRPLVDISVYLGSSWPAEPIETAFMTSVGALEVSVYGKTRRQAS